jgi:site-specific DNA recombinase
MKERTKERVVAAIYVRKSTEQRGRADESKSVERQKTRAKEFARNQGWATDDHYVFEDDGVSGTEFESRAGLQELLAALKPKPPFHVLIVEERKTIGREQSETAYTIKRIAKAGVDIVEYRHGKSLVPKSPTDKLVANAESLADEDHGVKSGERTWEAHAESAKLGYVVGGRKFGFRNRKVYVGFDLHGNPAYSHTERVVEKKEAAVVVRIFQLYASGLGCKAIAKRLNNEKAQAPIPFVRRDPTKVQPLQHWAPATIRSILCSEDYCGKKPWNHSQKRDEWREINQRPRPRADWISGPYNKDLQIVSAKLWEQVRSRRAATEDKTLRFADGRLSGRPPNTPTKNLLAGLATCAECGGGLCVETSPRKRGRVREYLCHRHRNHGTCTNARHICVDEMNEAVLQAIEQHALTPEAIAKVVALTERDDAREQQVALIREHKDVAKRIERYVQIIETTGDITSVAEKLRELEARRTAIEGRLRSLLPLPRLPRRVIEDRLAEWRRLLRQSTTQGRAVLQRILGGRIVFTPKGDGYTFEAPTRFDKLFSGVVVQRPTFIKEGTAMFNDERGSVPIGAEDTFDGDYGRLLEQALKSPKGSTSPTGFEPVFWP